MARLHVSLSIRIDLSCVVKMQHALIISKTNHFIDDLADLILHNYCTHAQRRKLHLPNFKFMTFRGSSGRDNHLLLPPLTFNCPVSFVVSRIRSKKMSCLSAEHIANRSL